MGKTTVNLLTIIIVFTFVSLVAGCDKFFSHDTGYLEGKISIGPLCPVERVPPDPGCLPTAETYKAYPVSVWTSGGRREMARLNPSLDGFYQVSLVTGKYLVKLDNGNNIPGSSNLPVLVSIAGRDTTVLNINIDTGIR